MQAIIEQIKTLYASMVAKEGQINVREVALTNREAILQQKVFDHEQRVKALHTLEHNIEEAGGSLGVVIAAKKEMKELQEKINLFEKEKSRFEDSVLSTQKTMTEKENALRDKENILNNSYKELRSSQEALKKKEETYKNDLIRKFAERG